MTVRIGLLRAVNVSGVNRLPMARFREMLAGIGLPGAKTYIQSGNVVFRSDHGADELALRIANAIETEFGYRVPVLIRSLAQVEDALARNPFPEALDQPNSMHFFFLGNALPADIKVSLEEKISAGERLLIADDLVYLHAPEGIGRSVLAYALMKQSKVLITARNLRSVLAIVDLARSFI